MYNDISHITDSSRSHRLPYTIYYPGLTSASTHEELARRKPEMMEQIARACVIGNYQTEFDGLNIHPSEYMMREAIACPNKYYLEALQGKQEVREAWVEGWKRFDYKDIRA
jgi:hypothetical protein